MPWIDRLRDAPRASRQASRRPRARRLKFESLERRWMLAADFQQALGLAAIAEEIPAAATAGGEIHGVKWIDVNGNGLRDPQDAGLAGVTIYLDADGNGEFDPGEPSTVTAADNPATTENEAGAYSFTGLMAGTYIVREVVPAGFQQTFPVPVDNDFDIDVVFPDDSLTPLEQSFFTDAAARWEQIIRGDLPDVFVAGLGLVDDIVIEATAPAIDGPGQVLGAAGPRTVRTAGFLPASGEMIFDSADLPALIAAGQFDEVIVHEMGHVLGIGTIWRLLGLLAGDNTVNPQFLGPQATAEYNAIFGLTASSVPVEGDQGGAGTRYAHWDEATLFNELMTGFLNANGANPLSRITVGQMADLGYDVDINAADFYAEPPQAVSLAVPGAPPVEGRILAIQPTGDMVEPLPSAAVSWLVTPNLNFWTIDLGDGEIVVDVDFGNHPLPGSISGTKWHDRDADGVRDEGEEGLAGWTVYLDQNQNGKLDQSTSTIASIDVPGPIPAQSTVYSELVVTGLVGRVRDVNVRLNISHTYDEDLQAFLISPSGTRVELFSSIGGSGNNFSNTTLDDEAATAIDDGSPPFNGTYRPFEALATFDGEDVNGTWLLEVTDYVLADSGTLNSWSLTISHGEQSAETDAEGHYEFEQLPPGDYTVTEVAQPDWHQSYPAGQADHSVSLAPGQSLPGVDFGNYHKAYIGGIVWNDRDGDGSKDADEPLLPGWTVFLDKNGNGQWDHGPATILSSDVPKDIPDLTTITSHTAVAGLGLVVDLDVTVNVAHPYASDVEVFLVSPKGTRVELFTDVGVNGDNFVNTTLDDEAPTAIVTGAAPFTGRYRAEGLLSAFDGEDPNGLWTLEVADDANIDVGTLLGWSLSVTTAEPVTVTNASGEYGFAELNAGVYSVVAIVPPGWAPTVPANSQHEVTLVSGEVDIAVNFGNRQGSVRGLKWNDLDNDGVRDEGEPGLPGWTIYIDVNNNGHLDNEQFTVASTQAALPIPDFGTITSHLQVSDLASVADVNLSISIQHSYVTDLDVYLISPSGTRVELFTDVGGTTENFDHTVFDDEATTSILVGVGPFSGSFQPEELLSGFDGENPNGTWTLEVSDDSGNDVGDLLGWSLTLTTYESSTVTDAAGEFAFVDLPPGPYVVRETGQAHWTPTFPVNPALHAVVLATGEQATLRFGDHSDIRPGDYDRDDDVDGDDILVWQRELGLANLSAGSGADGNYSTTVDADDLAVVTAHFGEGGQQALAAGSSSLGSGPNKPLSVVDEAFAELDAASLAGPMASGITPRFATGAARPRFRPLAATVRPAVAATPLLLAITHGEGDDPAADSAFIDVASALDVDTTLESELS